MHNSPLCCWPRFPGQKPNTMLLALPVQCTACCCVTNSTLTARPKLLPGLAWPGMLQPALLTCLH
jgi:hypothetical protein